MKDEHTHAATTSKEQAAESGSGSTGSPRPHVISRRVFSTRSAWTLALLLAATVFIIDQGTKYLVVTRMEIGERIPVIEGLLWWYSIRNSGAAFSFGEGATWVFTLIMAIAAVVVVYTLRKTRALGWVLALGGLLGGVLGNLFDRLFRGPGFGTGHVVDFISVPNFAIFNIADSAICVCMALIVLLNFRGMTLAGTRAESPQRTTPEHHTDDTPSDLEETA